MKHALRLVIGGRGPASGQTGEPATDATPQQVEARALVEAWLDAPSLTIADAADDLIARIAQAFCERDEKAVATSLPG